MSVTQKSFVKTTPAATAAPAVADTIDLELVLYARYYRGGTLYERDHAYRFSADQAEILLAEAEDGTQRPVWRRYKARPVQQQLNSGVKHVINAQDNNVKHLADPDGVRFGTQPGNRIDVGSDDELVGIIGNDDSAGVTV